MNSNKINLSLLDKVIVSILKFFPSNAYTKLLFKIARIEKPIWFKDAMLKTFVFITKVDLSQAEESDIKKYKNLSQLFIRRLNKKSRIIDDKEETIISPVDGEISQIGLICENSIVQAKSKKYSLKKLLKDPQVAERYYDGNFITIYLAPKNYHRVHFPLNSQVESMSYIPGNLLSVNAFTARKVDELFVNQERAVINLKMQSSESLKIAPQISLVMVGALGVGSINTVWHGMLTPPYENKQSFYYPYGKIMGFQKGEELGFFNLGSTVILLFPKDTIKLEGALKIGSKLRMGQVIAKFSSIKKQKTVSKYQESKEKKMVKKNNQE